MGEAHADAHSPLLPGASSVKRRRVNALSLLMTVDGGLFVLIALVVFAAPNPQPALVRPLDADAVRPFEDTRRLLAAMFFASGCLVFACGWTATERRVFAWVSCARLASFAAVAAINVSQLRGGHWKRPPLFLLLGVWFVLASLYAWFGWRAA